MQVDSNPVLKEDVKLSTYVQDTSLTGVLRQVIAHDTHIEGLNARLVERLEHYQ